MLRKNVERSLSGEMRTMAVPILKRSRGRLAEIERPEQVRACTTLGVSFDEQSERFSHSKDNYIASVTL